MEAKHRLLLVVTISAGNNAQVSFEIDPKWSDLLYIYAHSLFGLENLSVKRSRTLITRSNDKYLQHFNYVYLLWN